MKRRRLAAQCSIPPVLCIDLLVFPPTQAEIRITLIDRCSDPLHEQQKTIPVTPTAALRSRDDSDVQRPPMRVSGPTFDSTDPIAFAEFYQRLLGWPIIRTEEPEPGNPPTGGWAILRSPSGDQKNEVQWEPHHRAPVWPSAPGEPTMMMHLDIGIGNLNEGVEWAIAQGARLAEHQPQEDVRVMLDPDGYPFCLFPDPSMSYDTDTTE